MDCFRQTSGLVPSTYTQALGWISDSNHQQQEGSVKSRRLKPIYSYAPEDNDELELHANGSQDGHAPFSENRQ